MVPGPIESVLYSVTMKKIATITLVACVILLIVAVFISPIVDIQPSALRAQQWLILVVAMFSLALLVTICLVRIPGTIGPPICEVHRRQLPCIADLACCLLC
jgi:hypothetical protein